MNWTEITVSVPIRDGEAAAAIANMAVPYGIYIEDYSDLEAGAAEIAHTDLIDESLIARDRQTVMIHIYVSECDNAAEAVAFLSERLRAAGIEASIDTVGVNDAEWNENWKKYFKAFEVGRRLAVCPSWEGYDNKEQRQVLHIDPGAAFGTGTHATTSLCLELLEETVDRGMNMLDIGCGSGILAIASVLLGADRAVGVDIDAQSVKTARENAEINSLSDRTEFIVGDLAERVSGKYDIICANIVADVIIKLLDSVRNYMNDGAALIISGIIDLRAGDVRTAAERAGFTLTTEAARDNWCAYILYANTFGGGN